MAGLFDTIFAGASGVAENLLHTLGITAVVKLRPDTTYNPSTGDQTELVPDEITVYASPPESYGINEIDGTNIVTGDVKNTIGANPLNIANVAQEELERAELIINGETLKIVAVNPVYSGNSIAAYELQMRK